MDLYPPCFGNMGGKPSPHLAKGWGETFPPKQDILGGIEQIDVGGMENFGGKSAAGEKFWGGKWSILGGIDQFLVVDPPKSRRDICTPQHCFGGGGETH